LPLAIELAAARVKLLPPPALLKRLDRSLPVLTGGARDLEARQQTMRNTLSWSYELLLPEEQRLFRRLAVFVGGCTLEVAEAVCAAPDGTEPLGIDVLQGLSQLVDHSLVQQREEGGEPRFGMLQVVREYALEQLTDSGEAETLRQAHAVCYLAMAEAMAPELRGSRPRTWLDRLERDHDNLRAALVWAQTAREAETGMRLAMATGGWWMARGHLSEGRAWMDGLLPLARPEAAAVSPAVRARAFFWAGMLAFWQVDLTAATDSLETGLALAREADEQITAGWALNVLGQVAAAQRDYARSARYCDEALALARHLNEPEQMAMSLNTLALNAYYQGRLETAWEHGEEALRLHREARGVNDVASTLDTLARVELRRGHLERATMLGQEVLWQWRELGHSMRGAEARELVAMTLGAAGNGARAARLLGAAAASRERLQVPCPDVEQTDIQAAISPARAALG
jgi:hypothetical protein